MVSARPSPFMGTGKGYSTTGTKAQLIALQTVVDAVEWREDESDLSTTWPWPARETPVPRFHMAHGTLSVITEEAGILMLAA